MKKSIYTLFLIILGFQLNGQQNFLTTNGKAIVNQNGDTILLRGMGLGGWMVQEGYMLQTASFANAQHKIRAAIEQLIGTADTDLFYEAWLANHFTKKDLDSLKSWGFNSVRLPMHYNLFTLPIEDEPVQGQQTWLTKGFELTDSVVSWCKQNQMYVILDLHAAPGGQGYDEGISDYDPNKPSLWESQANRDKMVALWKKLAERYVNEEWVAAYDLLNEPNWNLPGGTLLRTLYEEVIDSIRVVDPNHIVIIEGNWFANDFTGLTPPWDNNMVYGPHKYWSFNEQSDIQWVLDIQNNYNVPLYFGESGENSNVWFRDAIRLFESNGIGWAWWPLKKVESIAGPLSVTKTPEYQALLDYWEGNGPQPSAAVAKATLMQLAEDLKIENCRYQKDVIDAMFRQVYSNEPKPYRTQDIPGPVIATDYDMGVVGVAYDDPQVATYHVSTNNFTAWNNGWQYRNDGIDIEVCTDNVFTNGFNVGWTDNDEWLLYDVNVAADGVYDIEVRAASGTSGGQFHFEMDDAAITPVTATSGTGGWQNWQTFTIQNVILKATDKKLKFYVDNEGFNVSSFNFIQTGTTTSGINTTFMDAVTVDDNTVQMNINKEFDPNSFTTGTNNFSIFANGNSLSITNIQVDTDNPRIVYFTVNHTMKFNEVLKISYTGNTINAIDGTPLQTFTLEDIRNTLPSFHLIPGKIEAEDYFFESGVQLEAASDQGGGFNIGFLDPQDYLDYDVEVATTGTYQIDFRNASLNGSGVIELQLVDDNGVGTTFHTQNFSPTGGWQTWTTTSATNVQIPAGRHTMRLLIVQGPFNLNWMDFTLLVSTNDIEGVEKVKVFPIPSEGIFNIQAELTQAQDIQMEVYNVNGQVIWNKTVGNTNNIQEQIGLTHLPDGYYFLKVQLENGQFFTRKLVKIQ